MKKGILFLAITLMGSFAYAQKVPESEVPAAVKAAFMSFYPKTTVEKWKKENGNYKAKFDEKKTEMCVIIDPNGKLIKTITEIEVPALPKAATDYAANKHSGKKIKKAKKITAADGLVTYEMEIHESNLCFDSNGNFLSEEKEKKKH
jgi:hypothetical protein